MVPAATVPPAQVLSVLAKLAAQNMFQQNELIWLQLEHLIVLDELVRGEKWRMS
jgi:hypothetical protein